MTDHPKCEWCLKNRKPSDWEQESFYKGWHWSRLCVVCWRKRENNPWNALLPLRKNPVD